MTDAPVSEVLYEVADHIATITLKIPMWLTPPATLHRQTLIEQIISSHPMVLGGGELPDVRDALGDVSGALSAYRQARDLGGLDSRVLDHINRRSAVLAAGE